MHIAEYGEASTDREEFFFSFNMDANISIEEYEKL